MDKYKWIIVYGKIIVKYEVNIIIFIKYKTFLNIIKLIVIIYNSHNFSALKYNI